tara:strand:- start:253 stop:1746 length:1494 start_codon:yes stop_codon:yes gene_type:complete
MHLPFLLFLLPFLPFVASFSTKPIHVVVISRHGVRTPYSPLGGDLKPEAFKPYSKRWKDFPVTAKEWGVPSIEGQLLTDHGKVVIKRMGTWFQSFYSELFASPINCDTDIFFYADNCTRDVQTATEFLTGMAPTCANNDISLHDAVILFNQGGYTTSQCKLPTPEVIQSLLGGSKNQYQAYNQAHATFVNDIQDVIDCCTGTEICNGVTPCTLSNIPTEFIGHFWSAVNGPVFLSGYFASYFTLAALNNMTLGLVSYGSTLSEITSWYHAAGSTLDVIDGAASSPSFASTLASHILASLQQAATGKNIDAVEHGPETKFVYMAGHDTNLVLLRTLLDLTWLADGWKENDPAPGGMLIFELYENDDNAKQYDVEIYFQVATPKQIRNAEILDETSNQPSRTPVLLPGCLDLRCPLQNVTDIILLAVNTDCVGIPTLTNYIDTLINNNNNNEKQAPAWAFIIGAVGLVVVSVAIVVPLTLFFERSRIRRRNDDSYLLGE